MIWRVFFIPYASYIFTRKTIWYDHTWCSKCFIDLYIYIYEYMIYIYIYIEGEREREKERQIERERYWRFIIWCYSIWQNIWYTASYITSIESYRIWYCVCHMSSYAPNISCHCIWYTYGLCTGKHLASYSIESSCYYIYMYRPI